MLSTQEITNNQGARARKKYIRYTKIDTGSAFTLEQGEET